ncbi:hypothetical protein MWN34_18435 [Ancylobacter sp. 6x-1]|uniref:Uncharacterized protein n=1 Tax=Ancylobacter crimeensis TaxID=2579147 RepID=A0ABT0DG82_9HYPH|nr:hypothetical protein [Ancylobacter crimeensis]MCK0198879.1 hypothetical protein [Ancylobacter crimeensis]
MAQVPAARLWKWVARIALVAVAAGVAATPLHAAQTMALRSAGEQLMPVAMRCADENGGAMEVVSRNAGGTVERMQLFYRQGKPYRIVVGYGFMGSFEDAFFIDIADRRDELEPEADEIVTYALDLADTVCSAKGEARRAALGRFDRNVLMLSGE